ncbi:MAG TPA: twin-arginine translocase TatA/TatE family subunit [Legionella sp.]|nr:twin-arginine translocase TatA/TatE family subunit [Legionella sp.]
MGLSGISPMSLLLIFLIVVALFGTQKMKHLGTDVGNAIKNFRRALNENDDKPS